MKVTFDNEPELRRILNGEYETLVKKGFKDINRRLNNIMGALSNLVDAVNNNNTTFAQGLEGVESAMTELASDIAGIPGAADVQAEADRISAHTATVGTALGGLAQRMRDAVPTAAPGEPLPPVEQPVSEPQAEETTTEEVP